MIDGLREATGSGRAHSSHRAPLSRIRFENSPDASKPAKKRASGLDGDPGDGGEQSFCGLGAGLGRRELRVHRPVAANTPLPTMGQPKQPLHRVIEILAIEDIDALVHDGQECSADRVPRDGTVTEIGTLHQQVRTRIPTNPIDLPPQATLDKGQMQILHRLTLNDGAGSDEIIARRELSNLHRCSKLTKQLAWTRPLVRIDDHPNRLIHHQPSSLRDEFAPKCANSFREAKRT